MHLNPLAALLKDWKPALVEKHEPGLPILRVTPRSENNKVVGDPTRIPVNRQAALIIHPFNCWLSKAPFGQKDSSPKSPEVVRLEAELKTERKAHAATCDELGKTRQELRKCRAHVAQLLLDVEQLKTRCSNKDSIIAQLEDLRL